MMRHSLIGPTGEVVGRSDEQDPDGWMPVDQGATVVAVRYGDFVAGADGIAGPPPVFPLAAQSFATDGLMTIKQTWSGA